MRFVFGITRRSKKFLSVVFGIYQNFSRFVFRFQFDEEAYSRNNFFVVKRLRIHWVEL